MDASIDRDPCQDLFDRFDALTFDDVVITKEAPTTRGHDDRHDEGHGHDVVLLRTVSMLDIEVPP